VVWCVSGPGIHDELQSRTCWCVVRQTTNVAEDGITTVLIIPLRIIINLNNQSKWQNVFYTILKTE